MEIEWKSQIGYRNWTLTFINVSVGSPTMPSTHVAPSTVHRNRNQNNDSSCTIFFFLSSNDYPIAYLIFFYVIFSIILYRSSSKIVIQIRTIQIANNNNV